MGTVGSVGRGAGLEDRLLAPMRLRGPGFWTLVGALLLIIALGGVAYTFQVRDGLLVTGMRDRIFWGMYIGLFEFFLGVAGAGTFISCMLRLTNARWRAPVTRGAEIIAVAGLVTAFLFISLDIGRPDRMHHMLLFGRWESPLMWDVFGISTYLVGSWIYLYFGLIPDIALFRDRLGGTVSGPRRAFYRFAATGWTSSPAQVRSLARALGLMTVMMLVVAVMMTAVASWIFSMTPREPWSNPMFGLYFVGGASFSGIGLLVLLMAVLRRIYRLEDYITRDHFVRLGYLLAVFAAIMMFFNVSDFVMSGYKLAGEAHFNLYQMVYGGLAPVFWTYIWGGLLLPIAIVLVPFTRNITGIVVASVVANIGMFLERYFVVVGGLRVPLNPYEAANYAPSWVEWALAAAGSALFVLVVVVLIKLFPPFSVWEMRETLGSEPGPQAPSTAAPARAGA
ncbi:MAG: NrfD/PsrC family molybdoenzyme membrane anchor subunit [Dehalococcoidia bacterium]